MSYNTGIGIGNALGMLPQGILQGEEIQRRRQREDENASMARAEFQNRQAIFGRQKAGWEKDDAVNKAFADFQAGLIDRQQMADTIAAAGAGREGFDITQRMNAEDRAQGVYDMQKDQFDLYKKNVEEQANDRALTRDFVMGRFENMLPAIQNSVDPSGKSVQVVEAGLVRNKAGNAIKSPDGVSLVYYKFKKPDGTFDTKVLDVAQAGAALGSTGLMTLAAQERAGHQWQAGFNLQQGQLAEARRQGREIEVQRTFEAERQARAKALELQGKQDEDYLKQLSGKLADAIATNQGNAAAGIRAEMDKVQKRVSINHDKVAAAYGGYKTYDVTDDNGNVIGVDWTRTAIPMGEKDRTYAVDVRPKDSALWVNPDNTQRMAAAITLRQDGETTKDYMGRVNARAKQIQSGWNVFLKGPNGQVTIAPAPKNTAAKVPDQTASLLAQGWKPVLPPNLDLGESYGMPDVPAANAIADRAADTTYRSGGSRSYGVGGGRRGSVPMPSGVSPKTVVKPPTFRR